MPNMEFDIPMSIVAPTGTLLLNQADADTGYIWRVVPDNYSIVPSLRVTSDNISQADGSVLHTRYKTGLVATFQVVYFVTDSGTDANPVDVHPACGADLRLMHEQLMLVLNDLRRLDPDPAAVQRYFWTPTGYGDQRMIDDIQILSWPDPNFDYSGVEGNEASVTFSIEAPFPYAIDATEIDTDITNTGAVANAGNSDQSPVIKVHGPFTAFTLTNEQDVDENGNPKSVVYDSSRPGGIAITSGHYAQIDFFQGTIFKDGDVLDLIASLDPTMTDFWVLKAATSNTIDIGGGATSITVLSNNAWA